MTQSDSAAARETRTKSFARRVNSLRNLALQGTAELAAPHVDSIPLSQHYVVIGDKGPQLRQNGSADSMAFSDDALAELAKDQGNEPLDLVFIENSCIDLSFSLPDALLPELRQIIENEVKFRSPFSETASVSIWVAEEQSDGGWRARAAVMLKSNVAPVMAQLRAHGLSIGVVRRTAPGFSFAATPAWAGYGDAQKPQYSIRNLPLSLKLGLLGAVIFLASALAATVAGGIALSQTRAEADAARATLAAQAQSMASAQRLDTSLGLATDKLAMTGTLSGLLPDGVWLDQLIVDDDTVTLVGFAPSAAEITRILSTLPQLSDIKFASPVTRDNSQGLERFRISASLAGAAG